MNDSLKYFEDISKEQIVFFRNFCKVNNIEIQFTYEFTESLIKKYKEIIEQKTKERSDKGYIKLSYRFVQQDYYRKKVFPTASKDEKEINLFLSICHSIKRNILYYGEPKEPENSYITKNKNDLTPQQKRIYEILKEKNLTDEKSFSNKDCLFIGKKIEKEKLGKYKNTDTMIATIRRQIERTLTKLKEDSN